MESQQPLAQLHLLHFALLQLQTAASVSSLPASEVLALASLMCHLISPLSDFPRIIPAVLLHSWHITSTTFVSEVHF